MAVVTIQQAQASLSDLIHRLMPGEELVITEGDRPVARLVGAEEARAPALRQLGSMHGTVRYISTDFDAPLEVFKEYME
jgi:prevent-host-death family protein